ncbi:uncharacterized protein BT62DRAFT_1006631 [Guyanagaster necrorhizus]|uniref:Non-reducing end beta-L-arabinofuranosidase-like GH127 middle domain-containing protein n=1 Tax=Guyanagaster necrorhizus TaxID=856835 RepID=A0A9P7VSF2_9AGAR|nr:uncharacterized protein BT62DRAFT_1006631 [Guyanagaster necrorhizus MCA 3950]KAG7445620.1 hypothetical protein BT62DRAFT_1006631 [Guyanagaster necrorhizus MCA 3950]
MDSLEPDTKAASSDTRKNTFEQLYDDNPASFTVNNLFWSPFDSRNAIPTGAIKPAGWALDQGNVQAEGLAGHLMDFDSYVNGSIWVEGGSIEYSAMHESAPYWFNGMVALAFQLEDKRLLGQVRAFLDWTLDHQGDDGWIGPEVLDGSSDVPRLTWPRYLVLMGLVQYAEADPSQTERIVGAMHSFITLVHSTWASGSEGDPEDGFQFEYQYVRWEELVYSLQWLYDNYPNGQEDILIETMQLLRDSGFSWKDDWYTEASFAREAVTSFFSYTHGVNNAEALKSEALAYRFTGDPTDVQSTFDRLDMIYQYHGRASGTFSADEHLAGLGPSHGTELCAVVEQIFSLATIYQIFGNNSVADRAERIAYNALPAGIMHDWWSHQYDQEVNQIWAREMDPSPWGNNGPRSNIFGFEPNYPCCTVNHPQGYPKFWAHAFMTDPADDGLLHVFLGPYTYSGIVGASNQVDVVVDTIYPFSNTLKYQIATSEPLIFKIRIPDWAAEKSVISVNGEEATTLTPDDANFQVVELLEGSSTIALSLHAVLDIEKRFNDAIAINYGALNYAIELSYNNTVTEGLRSEQALSDVKTLYPNAPAEYLTPACTISFIHHTLLPTTEWRLAIDPSTIEIVDRSSKVSNLPFYVWSPGSQPITMSATACQIDWEISNGTAASPPQSPNACASDTFAVKLVPFGAAKLRLGEIPTMIIA